MIKNIVKETIKEMVENGELYLHEQSFGDFNTSKKLQIAASDNTMKKIIKNESGYVVVNELHNNEFKTYIRKELI